MCNEVLKVIKVVKSNNKFGTTMSEHNSPGNMVIIVVMFHCGISFAQ